MTVNEVQCFLLTETGSLKGRKVLSWSCLTTVDFAKVKIQVKTLKTPKSLVLNVYVIVQYMTAT